MRRLLIFVAVATLLAAATSLEAGYRSSIDLYILHDHPNGNQVPPTYGLRIDSLLAPGPFTFSFDAINTGGSAMVTMTYNDVTSEIHITGTAYGGLDIGDSWDPTMQGWIQIDFRYRTNIAEVDDCSGGLGNDLYVQGADASNNGTIALMGWGGNQVFNFSDKADGTGCSFIFDNDTDSKGNATIANDLTLYSGSGWLMPGTQFGARDWLFIGETVAIPVEETTWGDIKSRYQGN